MDRRRRRQALPGRRGGRDRGRRRSRRSRADRCRHRAAQRDPVRARHDVHDRGGRAIRRRARALPSDGRPAHLSGVGRERGGRDRDQDGARVPPGSRRRRPDDDHRPAELVPRQHARRARCEREGTDPQALHRVARAVPPRAGGLRVPMRQPAAPRRVRRLARLRARTDDLARRCGHGRRVHRRAGRWSHARGRRSHRRLLAGGRRGLPQARRAGDRGRGHDGVRAARPVVRRGPLERSTRHPHGREGDDERLRAVRVRGGERRGLRHDRDDRVRPWVHVVAPRARRSGRARGDPPARSRVA